MYVEAPQKNMPPELAKLVKSLGPMRQTRSHHLLWYFPDNLPVDIGANGDMVVIGRKYGTDAGSRLK